MRSDARKRLTAAREEGCGAEGGVVSGLTKGADESQTAFTIRCIKAEAWTEGWLAASAFDYHPSDAMTRNPYIDSEPTS